MKKVEKVQRFQEIFSPAQFENDSRKFAIFIGNPDPDAIGSGMGMRLLLRNLTGIDSDIIYSGEISHPQNKTLVNVLNITLLDQKDVLSDEQSLTERYNRFIFLDQTPREKWCSDLEIDVVFDHHKVNYDKAKLVDIQQCGACCSIVWFYLSQCGCEWDDDDDVAMDVVAAMLFGIKTDTNDLISENVTTLDFEAYQHLAKYAKRERLASIINYQYPAYYFEVRSRLTENDNNKIQDSFFIGGVGFISQARRDCLPMLADERVRMEGISTSIVFAVVGNHLEASVRSTNPAIDVNKLCKDIFGEEFGGGKWGCGAAKIPLGVLSITDLPNELKDKAWETYRDIVMQRTLHYCTGN